MKENKVQVFDNVLSESDFKKVYDTVTSSGCNGWTMGKTVHDELLPEGENQQLQFVKLMFSDIDMLASPELEELKPLFTFLDAYKLLRVKVNVLGMDTEIKETGYHLDINGLGYENIKIAVFYLNTNNGYTKTKGGQIVESVRNRVAILDNTTYHTGTNATDTQYRIVINVVYMTPSMYEEPKHGSSGY